MNMYQNIHFRTHMINKTKIPQLSHMFMFFDLSHYLNLKVNTLVSRKKTHQISQNDDKHIILLQCLICLLILDALRVFSFGLGEPKYVRESKETTNERVKYIVLFL